jgi:hypothetical protein
MSAPTPVASAKEPSQSPPARPWRAGAIGLGFGCAVFLCETLPLCSGPRWLEGPATAILYLSLLFLIPFILAVIAFPALFMMAAFSRSPRQWERCALAATIALSIFIAMRTGGIVREARLSTIAERGAPVIQELEACRLQTGAYPDSISLPPTGILAHPRFQYRLASTDKKDPFDAYELSVDCSWGTFVWDRMVYWPSKTYPSRIHGGVVTRIGNWARVQD